MNNSRLSQESRFNRLRREYGQILDEAADHLQTVLIELRAGPLTDLRREEARSMAHKLSGSGGTYGYAEISRAAGALEAEIDASGADGGDIAILSRLAVLIDRIKDRAMVEAPAQPTSASPVRLVQAGSAPAGPRRKLLLVEDDLALVSLLTSLMRDEVELVLAYDGAEAIAKAGSERPDLIILDNDLPDMSGIRILEELHADKSMREIPVVMLTGNKDPANVVAAVNAGAVDYFTKPFEPIPLVNHIRNLLSHTRRHVLVVDDDRPVRELLIHRFEALGFHAAGAEDGLMALEMARATRPDLIILDRMIPSLEGGAVLLELKQDQLTSEIPVIMLTARHAGGEAHAWLKRGAADFIPKPFDPDEVVFRAMRALGIDDHEG